MADGTQVGQKLSKPMIAYLGVTFGPDEATAERIATLDVLETTGKED